MGSSRMASNAIGAIIPPASGGSFYCGITTPEWVPEVKLQMVAMALNGSGIRDTARVLGVSPTTVMTTLKQKRRRFTR